MSKAESTSAACSIAAFTTAVQAASLRIVAFVDAFITDLEENEDGLCRWGDDGGYCP
jgi:hypothetical protein